MVDTTVLSGEWISGVPNEDPGRHPVILVYTNLPAGQNNAFYMDLVDLDKNPIVLRKFNLPTDAPLIPGEFNPGDPISFDVQDNIHKVVLWNGRRIRQRDYSFDANA